MLIQMSLLFSKAPGLVQNRMLYISNPWSQKGKEREQLRTRPTFLANRMSTNFRLTGFSPLLHPAGLHWFFCLDILFQNVSKMQESSRKRTWSTRGDAFCTVAWGHCVRAHLEVKIAFDSIHCLYAIGCTSFDTACGNFKTCKGHLS